MVTLGDNGGAVASKLQWAKRGGSLWEALLGDPVGGDGVTFTYVLRPNCYRRGPHVLQVEVAGGPKHHLWGCFDAQDQPTRYFHRPDSLLNEADELATVLWADRARRGSPPESRVEGLGSGTSEDQDPPRRHFLACAQHVRSCEACGEQEIDPQAFTAWIVARTSMEERSDFDAMLWKIEERWSAFLAQNNRSDLEAIAGFKGLAEVVDPLIPEDRTAVVGFSELVHLSVPGMDSIACDLLTPPTAVKADADILRVTCEACLAEYEAHERHTLIVVDPADEIELGGFSPGERELGGPLLDETSDPGSTGEGA